MLGSDTEHLSGRRQRGRNRRFTGLLWLCLVGGAGMTTGGVAQAATLEDIAALEAGKGATAAEQATPAPVAPAVPAVPVRAKPPVVPYRLPDGRQVNAADYRIVLFMQSGCPYCAKFDPLLAQISAQTGFKVFAWSLNGQGDVSFPAAIPAPQSVVAQFFGPGNHGVTPATWLINVNTLQAWPLTVGATDGNTFMQRINQALATGR